MGRNVLGPMPAPTSPGDYPNSEWAEQRIKYWKYWRHFDGDWLGDSVSTSDHSLRYPLRLNPLSMTCLLHAGFLFGEAQDGDDPLVTAVVEPWGRNSTEQQRNDAAVLTDLINRVWYENSGRAIQQEGGLVSQVLGGCVVHPAYDTSLEGDGRLAIRIDHVMPEYFFPVWAFNQYWKLLEAFVAFQITTLQAAAYGIEDAPADSLYQEHWRDSREYAITINGKPARLGKQELSGVPVGGRVPFVYIPHVRVGQFYGTSLLAGRDGIVQEINERFADVGDTISENARRLPWIANAQRPQVRSLSHGFAFVDLGMQPAGMGSAALNYPSGGGDAGQASVKWAMELLDMCRTDAYTPPVIYGQDEGSQRSALTLALRALPLLVHIRQERTYWTSGLNEIDRIILAIAAEKRIGGVTPPMIRNVRIWQEWAPVLPRDRQQLINETILRLDAGLIDQKSALNKMGDIRDLKTAMNLIREWLEFQAQVKSAGSNPFGGAGSDGEQAGLDKPTKPQASLSKED